MASSRKPRRADARSWDLLPGLRGPLGELLPAGSRVLVALSGGVDSVVLLDLLRRLAARRRWRLAALHVNHQLQPAAASWARFCRALCRDAGVPLRVVKADVKAGNSLERAARAARYAALLSQPADFVALAHNRDDQTETVLLHLLRGSGVHGLAGMKAATARAGAKALLVRPLLDFPRTAIVRYAEGRKLAWIEDPSNASADFSRNFLRTQVLPALEPRFPGCRDALVRAARHAGEAAQLLEALAVQDGVAPGAPALPLDLLRGLAPARAKNALAFFLRSNGIDIPSSERIEEALRQLTTARSAARLGIDFGARRLRVHRGELVLSLAEPAASLSDRVWQGEARMDLPELGGTLLMQRKLGAGISVERLRAGPVTIRPRRGGEKLRPHQAGATRTVKNLMQEAGMPVWERSRLPFIYCGDTLVCVPGLAIDSAFHAGPREAGIRPLWRGADPRAA